MKVTESRGVCHPFISVGQWSQGISLPLAIVHSLVWQETTSCTCFKLQLTQHTWRFIIKRRFTANKCVVLFVPFSLLSFIRGFVIDSTFTTYLFVVRSLTCYLRKHIEILFFGCYFWKPLIQEADQTHLVVSEIRIWTRFESDGSTHFDSDKWLLWRLARVFLLVEEGAGP